MVANGAITEHQRADVLFIRRVIVAPIWDIKRTAALGLLGGAMCTLARWKRESDFGS
jgi:hypothetical protein